MSIALQHSIFLVYGKSPERSVSNATKTIVSEEGQIATHNLANI